jgi:hypothetical protein
VNASGTSAGVIAGHGLVTADESFSLTADGVYGWSTGGASAAVSNGTFLAYLKSLTDVGIGSLSGGDISPDSRAEDPNDDGTSFASNSGAADTPEAVVFSFDTTGLASTTRLTMQSLPVSLWTGGDRSDVLVYDAGAGTVRAWLLDGNYGNPIDDIEAEIGGRWCWTTAIF